MHTYLGSLRTSDKRRTVSHRYDPIDKDVHEFAIRTHDRANASAAVLSSLLRFVCSSLEKSFDGSEMLEVFLASVCERFRLFFGVQLPARKVPARFTLVRRKRRWLFSSSFFFFFFFFFFFVLPSDRARSNDFTIVLRRNLFKSYVYWKKETCSVGVKISLWQQGSVDPGS